MKLKDHVRKILGRRTSEERHHAAKLQRQAQRNEQKAAIKEAIKNALAAKEAESPDAAKARLNAQFEVEAAKPDFDQRIPHPDINYNLKAKGGYADYYRDFVSSAVLKQLPSYLQITGYHPQQAEFNMLDYGCGLGRLGFAFTNYFGKRMDRCYFGYEVHPTACDFLRKAYAEWPNCKFWGDTVNLADSYVEIYEGAKEEAGRQDAAAVSLSQSIDAKLDLQISISVFTHMYRKAIVSVLKEIAPLMKSGGLCINSWLVVDDQAEAGP
jgi:SAM-dependent methyltransferase